jgi:2-dehydro-3-deoxygluconokinase
MHPPLAIKPARSARFDALALGEVMLRLDPGPGRVRTARSFQVWEGGGEYNVVRGLRRCFGLRTALVTAITDNEVGRLLEDLLLQGGVDLSHIRWTPFDGVGRTSRVGLNFTERGFGIRAGSGTYDRGHTAAAQMKPGDTDWVAIFRIEGVRWFHTGGIFAALSPTTSEVIRDAMREARKQRTIVSYDLNSRASLWKDDGGMDKAIRVNRAIVPLVDVLIGNEGDFESVLGIRGGKRAGASLSASGFKKTASAVVKQFPNLVAVAGTMRRAVSASRNDWGAALWYRGKIYEAVKRPGLEIFDRVGGGDGFAAGLIYGFLAGRPPAEAVNLGAAHGALVMTTPGDVSMATRADVEKVMKGAEAWMVR